MLAMCHAPIGFAFSITLNNIVNTKIDTATIPMYNNNTILVNFIFAIFITKLSKKYQCEYKLGNHTNL